MPGRLYQPEYPYPCAEISSTPACLRGSATQHGAKHHTAVPLPPSSLWDGERFGGRKKKKIRGKKCGLR